MPGSTGGASTNFTKIVLHDHPVEPPGRRPPRRPLLYLILGVAAIIGAIYLIDFIVRLFRG